MQTVVERAQKTLPVRVVTAYGESQASNYALALAFAGFMAMFPLILGALSIIGLAIRDPHTEASLTLLVVQVFPSTAQPELLSALHGVKASAGWLGLVSLAGLIWGAGGIFSTMEFALTRIFGTKQRDLLRQRFMGLLMMLVVVAAIVLLVLINAATAFFPDQWITSFAAGAVVMVALLVALYRFVPNRPFELGDVLPGALLTGLLIEALSFVFPLYARIAGGFNTYGAQFGLFFLLATWFYLISQLVLLGAVYNKFRLAESEATHVPLQAVEPEKVVEERDRVPRRSIFQRLALGAVVALAVAAGALRRRRPKAPA